MATTTTTAIRTALEALIVATDPTGAAKGHGKYRILPDRYTWETVPDAWKDRAISLGFVNEGEPLFFGVLSETDYSATADLRIAHAVWEDKRAALDRMNTDVCQIRGVLEKHSNFPTGVTLVRLGATNVTEEESFLYTTLTLQLQYTRAAA